MNVRLCFLLLKKILKKLELPPRKKLKWWSKNLVEDHVASSVVHAKTLRKNWKGWWWWWVFFYGFQRMFGHFRTVSPHFKTVENAQECDTDKISVNIKLLEQRHRLRCYTEMVTEHMPLVFQHIKIKHFICRANWKNILKVNRTWWWKLQLSD